MIETTNFKFKKPEKTDPANITAMNENWDIIDKTLNNISNKPPIVPIAKGGTGASNVTTARKNLYAAPEGLVITEYSLYDDSEDTVETILDKIVENMRLYEIKHYEIDIFAPNSELSLPNGFWFLKVYYDSRQVIVNATKYDETCGGTLKLNRVRKDTGLWQPWEYENPPMEANVEYRTTEKWMGKPVYTKLVEYTAPSDLGNTSGVSGFSIIFGTQNFAELVRYCGNIVGTGRAIPCFYNPEDGGGYVGVNFMNHQGVSLALNKKVIPKGTKIIIQVWYTKS